MSMVRRWAFGSNIKVEVFKGWIDLYWGHFVMGWAGAKALAHLRNLMVPDERDLNRGQVAEVVLHMIETVPNEAWGELTPMDVERLDQFDWQRSEDANG